MEKGVEGRGEVGSPLAHTTAWKDAVQYRHDIADSVDEHHFHDEHAAIKLRLGQFVWEF